MPGFTHVVLLSRIDAEVLAHPLHILEPYVVVLAQGKTDPILGQQDALQVRMIGISNPEHVVDFALEPIRRRPHRNNTLDLFEFLDSRLHANVFVLREGIEDVDDFELLVLRPVNRGFIDQVVEGNDRVVAKKRHDLRDSVLFHLDLILTDKAVRLDELAPKLLLDRVHQRTRPRLLLRTFRLGRSGGGSGFRARWWWRRFGYRGFGFPRGRSGSLFFLRMRRRPRSTLFPYSTLFRPPRPA